MENTISTITRTNNKERSNILRWYARQAEEIRISIQRDRFKIFHFLKNNENISGKPEMIDYCALIIGIKNNGWKAERDYKSQKKITYKEVKQLSEKRIAKAKALKTKRRATKKEKILKKRGVVHELRNEGMGFYTIAKYLKKAHRINVTAVYLNKIWQEIENNEHTQ